MADDDFPSSPEELKRRLRERDAAASADAANRSDRERKGPGGFVIAQESIDIQTPVGTRVLVVEPGPRPRFTRTLTVPGYIVGDENRMLVGLPRNPARFNPEIDGEDSHDEVEFLEAEYVYEVWTTRGERKKGGAE